MPSRRRAKGSQSFQDMLRDYTSGVSGRELRRLWEQDAGRAYDVLTRDQEKESGSSRKDPVSRLFRKVRLAFLGLSSKLSPARRAVFAFAIITALLGLLNINWLVRQGNHGGMRITVESSPFLFTVAFGALLFLFAVELVDRVLVRDELEVARQLQSDLMPRAAPTVPGWSFAHAWRTANEVGGDYYAFVSLPNGRLALMIGDASGHGMAAGLLMAIANATLQTAVEIDPTPLRACELLHRLLLRTGDRRAFMSLFYAVLDPATGALEYICAGHPFPILRRADGRTEEIGTGGLPLGMSPTLRLVPGQAVMAPGDTLVLYTDGLPEALKAGGGEAFGFDHLERLVVPGGSAEGIHARIWTEFRVHAGEGAIGDDVTLVVVARDGGERGAAGAPPPLPPLPPSVSA